MLVTIIFAPIAAVIIQAMIIALARVCRGR